MHGTRPAMPRQLASFGLSLSLLTKSIRVPLRLTCLRRLRPVQRFARSAPPPSVPLGDARMASIPPWRHARLGAPAATRFHLPGVALVSARLRDAAFFAFRASESTPLATATLPSSTLLIAALQINAASIRAPPRPPSFSTAPRRGHVAASLSTNVPAFLSQPFSLPAIELPCRPTLTTPCFRVILLNDP